MKTNYGIFAKERATLACYINIFGPSEIFIITLGMLLYKCLHIVNVVALQILHWKCGLASRNANIACIKKTFFLQVEKLNNLWQSITDLVLNDFLTFTDTQVFGHPFELFVKFRILYRFDLKTLKLAFYSGHRLVRVCDAFLE
jgi:hypothetical protein